MSGLVGSITYASMTYNNDIDNNNVIKGIKMANYLDTKILELELAEKNAESLIGTFLKTNDKIKDYNITFEYKGEWLMDKIKKIIKIILRILICIIVLIILMYIILAFTR